MSTDSQNIENQVIELEQYCKARMYEVYKVYLDNGVSGSKESRPEFDVMMLDANKRKFDVLLVWKLDRLSRSLKHLLCTLDTLSTLNISFICYNDNIDTTTPAGRLMFQMVGAFAEFERELIRERVKHGLKRARANGKKLGRPKLKVNENLVLYLLKSNSIRTVAKKLELTPSNVYRIQKYNNL